VFQAAGPANAKLAVVAEAAGGPKSCTTAEVGCGGNTVGQIGWRTIVVDKMHE